MTRDGDADGTATAYRHWDAQWRTEQGRAGWLVPEPWVVETAERLRTRGARTALDLGCGPGRHAEAFARAGLTTAGLDRSEHAVAEARRRAAAEGLPITYHTGDFTRLPFAAASFDHVLAWNVVYHGDEDVLARVLAEVRRVLRPGGLYQATMISKRNAQYGRGVEISPNTYVQEDGPEDKRHPHLFSDEHDILRTHRGMRLLELADREHAAPGSYHWHLLFEASADDT
ncbi:class I SAM-dependent methyltransferase [Sphaerisporangium aureirubrum]|uniref:Class I SAM-dependent methyltransferase n=1 Tax=Sphaerisporangium aureirubrum TaxID=1544736 RepID=A0ABW1NMI4_9ACTN